MATTNKSNDQTAGRASAGIPVSKTEKQVVNRWDLCVSRFWASVN